MNKLSEDNKILAKDMIKSRNSIAKKYISLQDKNPLMFKSGDEIIKRLDDLFYLQHVIKKYDIIIRYVLADTLRCPTPTLMTFYDDAEKWRPKIMNIKDYISN